MSWSIYSQGSKKITLREVTEYKAYDSMPAEEKEQVEQVRTLIIAEIGRIPETSGITVSANGSMTIEIATRKVLSSQVSVFVQPINVRGMVPEP